MNVKDVLNTSEARKTKRLSYEFGFTSTDIADIDFDLELIEQDFESFENFKTQFEYHNTNTTREVVTEPFKKYIVNYDERCSCEALPFTEVAY